MGCDDDGGGSMDDEDLDERGFWRDQMKMQPSASERRVTDRTATRNWTKRNETKRKTCTVPETLSSRPLSGEKQRLVAGSL